MNENVLFVAVYEDNNDLRESLSALISGTNGLALTGAYINCDHVEEDLKLTMPDVVLMDIDMPGTNGLEGLKRIRKIFPDVEVLMLTVFDDNDHVFECICQGASGYLLKKTAPAKIIEAIFDVKDGGAPMSSGIARKVLQMFPGNVSAVNDSSYQLSERERQVLLQLVRGLSYKLIAAELKISIDTVRAHIKKIYTKLHVHTMTEAVAKAIHNKIV